MQKYKGGLKGPGLRGIGTWIIVELSPEKRDEKKSLLVGIEKKEPIPTTKRGIVLSAPQDLAVVVGEYVWFEFHNTRKIMYKGGEQFAIEIKNIIAIEELA